MCGIAGRLSWDPPPQIPVLERMTHRLAHCGPDYGAIVVDGVIGLGHGRLAIIDLKPESHHPLQDATGRLIIVFNGEIYNHLQLRRKLENLGAAFRIHSDTEVILEAWKVWGVACLQRFNGMFALALLDRTAKTFFLARDRLGKKNLYYHLLPRGGIVFGSEFKALLADEEVPRNIDPDGLSQYFSLNYTLGATSMLAGVRKLQAGHFLLLDQDGRQRQETWWDLAPHFRNKLPITSEGEALEAWNAIFQVADCHFLDQAMYVDIRTWLVDDILVKVDRATMAHGLEARDPFLDYRTVEFAAALPIRYKTRSLQKKNLLKKSLAGRLPKDILHQTKAGFGVPVSRWLA
ncbi:MAG: asparagine synthetase B [Magnetococcales bacterium]|nr:asparagine synthetase B [Magnetococcales bacterium]